MMTTNFGNCPICGAVLHQVEPSTFSCPSGHYTVRVTAGYTSGTVTISLTAPQKSDVEVPKVFQDAFADREVLEP
jgi:hypothetical protein